MAALVYIHNVYHIHSGSVPGAVSRARAVREPEGAGQPLR